MRPLFISDSKLSGEEPRGHRYMVMSAQIDGSFKTSRWSSPKLTQTRTHDTSTLHRPQTNGIAQRAVRRFQDGTVAAHVQSGLTEEGPTTECSCHLRNICDTTVDGKIAYEKRCRASFKGLVIPFGATIVFKPIYPKGEARLHQFGARLLSGLLILAAGYVDGHSAEGKLESPTEMNYQTLRVTSGA